jgi:UDP-galactopyranose mutase
MAVFENGKPTANESRNAKSKEQTVSTMSGPEFPNLPRESQRIPTMVGPNLWRFEELEETFDDGGDLICLSHLRWNSVYQRPQHLMSRCARERRVFYVEEPVFTDVASARMDSRIDESGVCVAVPQLPQSSSPRDVELQMAVLLDDLIVHCAIKDPVLWYYTPMAFPFTRHVKARACVYDCMDELSLFRNAPISLKKLESELLSHCDVVFTGGMSLYESKQHLHTNIHPVPSSIDVSHFIKARSVDEDHARQKSLPHPRIGFAGVIDERLDVALFNALAAEHPDWQFIMVGPVVKIDPELLPKHPNIHYLGHQPYTDLPAFMAGWDVAVLLFAHNDSTRFISPTKTPEYLAAGIPVVSTSIRDVVRPYGEVGLVRIADNPEEFANAIEQSLQERDDVCKRTEWLHRVDDFLKDKSWERTWNRMMTLLDTALGNRAFEPLARTESKR